MSRPNRALLMAIGAALVGVPLSAAHAQLAPPPPVPLATDLFATTAADADRWLTDIEVALASPGDSPAPDSIADPTLRRMARVSRVMEKRWRALDANCDPAAVFALTYLVMTRGINDYIQAGLFDDGNFESIIVVDFAQLYFAAFDAFAAGHPEQVSKPWREALQAGASGTTTATQDLFLGMNAHINYNLAIVMAQVGLVDDKGRSRKPDHDRINTVLASVIDRVGNDVAERYDPSLAPGGANALATPAVLELIYRWREDAWQNATALSALPAAAHPLYEQGLQDYAATQAKAFEVPQPGGLSGADRRAYCQSHHPAGGGTW